MEWIDAEVEMPPVGKEVIGVICPSRAGVPYMLTCIREPHLRPYEVRELFSGGLYRLSFWSEPLKLPKKER